MRIQPESVTHLGMLIDRRLPDCNYASIRAIDVEADVTAAWEALPDAPVELTPKGLFRFLLWFAALVRGDLFRERTCAVGRPVALREGELLPFPGDPYDPNGLTVVAVDEQREVVAKGGHPYAEYFANIFLEASAPGRTRVYLATRAQFSRTLAGRFYFQGVRLFHGRIVDWALSRLKRFIEAGQRSTRVRRSRPAPPAAAGGTGRQR